MDENSYKAPRRILYADICRDGGSYVLCYSDSAGRKYELEMLVEMDSSGKRTGYQPPTVASYPIERRRALSWEVATNLQMELRLLLSEAADPNTAERAAEMLDLISRHGQL